ncbi:hypothetical protein L2E82_13577 [Cichorium intybus]|uniref:Uncharacterized protein n=1 Tax=Cichorium intybus TaxID=13427 RepID=A0ACB9EY01_CICIN|nr:hypothetical protein L2E82_13577 [Cichorium intybus]
MADEGRTLTDLQSPKIKPTKVIQSPTDTNKISSNAEGGETSSKEDEYMQLYSTPHGGDTALKVSNLMNEYGDEDHYHSNDEKQSTQHALHNDHEATTVMNSDAQGNAAADREIHAPKMSTTVIKSIGSFAEASEYHAPHDHEKLPTVYEKNGIISEENSKSGDTTDLSP